MLNFKRNYSNFVVCMIKYFGPKQIGFLYFSFLKFLWDFKEMFLKFFNFFPDIKNVRKNLNFRKCSQFC